jgi:hypothetical protein
MKDAITVKSTCEMTYKLRDAIIIDNLSLALYFSREVHDNILTLRQNKKAKACAVNCEVSHEPKDI